MTTRPVRTRRPRASWWALVVDLAFVLVFVLIGRSSHAEAVDPLGVLTTTWPFAVGLVVGVLLRVASGQGIEPSFVVVTAVVLGVLLVGWRLVAGLVGRRRGSGRSA